MLIAELYQSLQGEGLLTGTPSVFVRVSGCNLRCWFCDTPFTSWHPEGEDYSVDEVVAAVLEKQMTHVVITGGEPMLYSEMLPLCRELSSRGLHLTIETAGTLFLEVDCDLMSISPKLASSTPSESLAGRWSKRHEQTRHQPAVIRQLLERYDYQLKFVIDTHDDLTALETWLQEFPEVRADRVLLMPQGTKLDELEKKSQWLAPWCATRGYQVCPRKHIEWYGATRGT
jgi:7-carboxy-7-deazaguanine synthase